MKRLMMSGLFLALGAGSALAQGAGANAEAGGSSGAMIGWSLAVIGLIVVLVVIARRLSTGEAWKQEIPIIVIGALLLNIGVWRVWATKQDELEKTNRTLQNKLQADQRQIRELQTNADQLRHDNAQWKQRDTEFQKLIQDWQTYLADLKKRADAAKGGPVRIAPAGKTGASKSSATKSDASKAPKKKNP
jgi:hypothetical protein